MARRSQWPIAVPPDGRSPATARLASCLELLVGDDQAAIGRKDRPGLLGSRDHGERDAVTDHVDGSGSGRPRFRDLGLWRAHRPRAVDDDDLGGILAAVGGGGGASGDVTVTIALTSWPPSGRYSF